jgi:hypothetical protein
MAIWHKLIINKTFVVPPDTGGPFFEVLSLQPALAVVLYQAIAFVGPDCLNKSIFHHRL